MNEDKSKNVSRNVTLRISKSLNAEAELFSQAVFDFLEITFPLIDYRIMKSTVYVK